MRLPAVLSAFAALTLALPAPAGSAGRELLVLNRGNEAIFWLSIGHAQAQDWSPDILRFNDVIDVGEGRNVKIALGDQCVYDVRAKYRDGDTVDLAAVDLCASSSVSFEH